LKRHLLLACMLLVGCATSQKAPVVERAPAAKKVEPAKAPVKKPVAAEKDWRPDTYTVKKGDTLYSIGLEYGFDYKDIAQWNNIQPPYVIRVGQALKLKESKAAEAPQESSDVVIAPLKTESEAIVKPLDGAAAPKTISGEPPLLTEPKAFKEPYSEQAMAAATVEPAAKPAEKPAEAAKAEPAEKTSAPAVADGEIDWSWPASGKVLAGFNDSANAKGVDIAGTTGQPVHAAAPGKVVYSGAGLRGYGKLVIIKHNKTYLSAYAHNSQILVKEGQDVVKGQKIAEMGSTDTDRVKLHFEIRKLGKPVDPIKYLPSGPG
jgi:lipoprotein NlpD